jgi:hypothetical protein
VSSVLSVVFFFVFSSVRVVRGKKSSFVYTQKSARLKLLLFIDEVCPQGTN